MAARRSQRRRGRRGAPGTALLGPLALGLGLALACLGLLLAVVSLGSRASPSTQVRPCPVPLTSPSWGTTLPLQPEACRGVPVEDGQLWAAQGGLEAQGLEEEGMGGGPARQVKMKDRQTG